VPNVLISSADGPLTTAATWKLVNAASFLDSEAGNTALTASLQYSQVFTPGAVTIDGIAVKLASRAAGTPANTISVGLYTAAGALVAGTSVTLNVSDLPACATDYSTGAGGWVLFAFTSAPVALAGATTYKVGAVLSATTTAVNLYRDGTALNWSRMLRTTDATNVPAAGDTLHVIGEHTGADTGTNWTVTMNETAVAHNAYGAGTDGAVAVTVGKRGTLNFGVVAATNYYLQCAGDLIVYSGGTFQMGVTGTGTTIPADSTAVLEFTPVADGGMGLIIRGGTVNTKHVTQKTPFRLLNADATINATTLTVDVAPTGWADNDQIAVGSTTRTPGQCELGAINVAPVGTAVTVDGFGGVAGGLAYAHDGNATGGPNGESIQGEVINITRSIKVRSNSATVMTYVYCGPTAAINFQDCEFYYLGEQATNKRGIEIATTTGSCSITYCSVHDCEDSGVYSVTATGGYTFSYNVCWNLNSAGPANGYGFFHTSTTGTVVISYNVWMYLQSGATTNQGISFGSTTTVTFTFNRMVGWTCRGIFATGGTFGTFTDNNAHSHGGGYLFTITSAGTASRLQGWRAGSGQYGLVITVGQQIINDSNFFGNTAYNIKYDAANTVFVNVKVSAESAYSVANGMTCSGDAIIINGDFGAVAHTNDLVSVGGIYKLYNTLLRSNTEVNAVYRFGQVRSQKHDGDAAVFKTFLSGGTIINETTIRHTSSGYAWKLTPSSTTLKLLFPGPTPYDGIQQPVVANAQVTVTAWVVRNQAYNGSVQPRLVLIGGLIGGIATDQTSTCTETSKAITAASNASPIIITSAGHGYATGDRVMVEGVVGNTAANGSWTITWVDADRFSLDGSTGNGAWVSGGYATRWQQLSVSGIPNELGCVFWYVDCEGTAGNAWVDDALATQIGLPATTGLDYPGWGLPGTVYTAGGGSRPYPVFGLEEYH
jgi:hypothetical protein